MSYRFVTKEGFSFSIFLSKAVRNFSKITSVLGRDGFPELIRLSSRDFLVRHGQGFGIGHLRSTMIYSREGKRCKK